MSSWEQGLPHLMRVGRVVADVDLQSAGLAHPCGREGVQILWRVHTPPYGLLLAEGYKWCQFEG